MTTLFINIGKLVGISEGNHVLRGKELAVLNSIDNAFLLVEDEYIAAFGEMDQLKSVIPHLPENVVDLQGKYVLPSWCDSHTHIVFAGSREHEFVDKINGLTYAEIAAKGGGILNSAARLAEASEDILFIIDLSSSVNAGEVFQSIPFIPRPAVSNSAKIPGPLEVELK